ncbi:FecR family protein [Salmonirosea aquatica]|uniref:DUF4974 domain-containing protein n=1 Tax=Salmonirosea aquatica TaxID=2654236 RepID=A0A7C9BM40_9BACT|nr:DUF4974 domain-containing protein [Cytophagaceae bacterium SJW1-29]
MKVSQAQKLLEKYREGNLTDAEKAILESWYLSLANTQRTDLQDATLEKHLASIFKSLPGSEQSPQARIIKFWPKWIAAASVLFTLFGGTYWYFQQTQTNHRAVSQSAVHRADVPPGDNRAVLTLANGERIVLEALKNGEFAREKNATIIKTKEGEIIYEQSGRSSLNPQATDGAVSYNTITTPKAGQYQVKLPDGTRVWLNAASSIRFPTVFSNQERLVEITGEIYFEVAKATHKTRRIPFIVLAGNQTVEVLGTRFNVSSYADEGSITTTLVEGSIKVHLSGVRDKGLLLKPGQQALLLNKSQKASPRQQPFNVREVDTRSVIAWKEGRFRFDNISLPELMRQLSRWYDVEVVYEGRVKEYEFVGQIERNTNLSKVLKILEVGGVKFRQEGKKIIISE